MSERADRIALSDAQIDELADALVESHDQLMGLLVAMRKRHRLTQDVVAERMGVSQPTVAAFERYDANPKLSTIRRYALAVGASIEHTVRDQCCAGDRSNAEHVLRGVVTDDPVVAWAPT